MITKHRVSNVIALRGETDVAPAILHLSDKENIDHKGMEVRYGDRKNIGAVFDAPQSALPVPTNINGKNI